MKATLIKDMSDDYRGSAALYRVDPPMEGAAYVIVSACCCLVTGRPETYIFPADESGEVTDWGELPGSLRDTLDHIEALTEAGYEIDEVVL